MKIVLIYRVKEVSPKIGGTRAKIILEDNHAGDFTEEDIKELKEKISDILTKFYGDSAYNYEVLEASEELERLESEIKKLKGEREKIKELLEGDRE